MNHALKKCINPNCGLTYEIIFNNYQCSCGSFLDILYPSRPSRELIEIFYQEEILTEIYIMKAACGDLESY